MKILQPPSSGSIGGVTHSHGRAGQYTRARRMPVQPIGTGRRGAVRSAFGAASQAWAGLGAVLQGAWRTYAESHPYVDRLGQAIKLTGHQMFVAIQANLANVSATPTMAVPVSDAVVAPILDSLTAVHAGAITATLGAGGVATDFVAIAVSRPQSSGRTFCKTFWQIAVVAGDFVTAQVLTAAYVAQFGSVSVGQRIFYRLTPVNQYGVAGVPVMGFIAVT